MSKELKYEEVKVKVAQFWLSWTIQFMEFSRPECLTPNREYQFKKKKNYFKAKKQTKPTSGVEKYNSASELYFRPKKIGEKKKKKTLSHVST